jgi:hypothetical protein
MNFGNINHETASAVKKLDALIGNGDYIGVSQNGRGALVFRVSLQGWRGCVGWRLAVRCLRMLWLYFYNKLNHEFLSTDDKGNRV